MLKRRIYGKSLLKTHGILAKHSQQQNENSSVPSVRYHG